MHMVMQNGPVARAARIPPEAKPPERRAGEKGSAREGKLAERQENRNVRGNRGRRGRWRKARGCFQRDIEVNVEDARAIKLGPRVECFGRP